MKIAHILWDFPSYLTFMYYTFSALKVEVHR